MSSLRPGVHHLALLVADLPRMEAFYTQVLGLRVLRRWPLPAEGGTQPPTGAGDRSVWLDLGAGAFLALERATASGRIDGGQGWHLVALAIDPETRGAWVARLTAAGHPVERRTPYTIYVRDPEGNQVGLSHWPHARPDAEHHV